MPKIGRDDLEHEDQAGQFEGLNLQSDAGAIGPLQLREARNLRHHEGKLVCRGGQARQNSTRDRAWEGLHDASDIGAPD